MSDEMTDGFINDRICLLDDDGADDADDKKKINTPSSVRAAVSLTLLIGIYVCAGMAFIPLQSQYVHYRVKELHRNLSNVSDTATCRGNSSDFIRKELDAVQKKSTRTLLYFSLCSSIPSVFVNLVIGSYSDFLGRKVIFLLPLLGFLANGISILSVIKWRLDLNYLFIGSVIDGLSGSAGTFFLASYSYTADSTNPEQSRTLAIAVLNGSMALAAVIGQLITGYFISTFGFFLPALTMVILTVADILVVAFVLPETLKERQNSNWSLKQNILKTLNFYVDKSSSKRRTKYIICLAVYFCAVVSVFDKGTVETLFQLGMPLCWDAMKIGYYNAIKLFLLGISSVLAIKILHPCCKDEMIAMIGMLSALASLVLESFSSTDWMMYLVPLVALLAGTTSPLFRATMSRMATESEQGALFASLAVIETITVVVSTVLFNSIYEATLETTPGAVFLLMAGFSGLGIALILVLLNTSRGVIKYDVMIVSGDEDNDRKLE